MAVIFLDLYGVLADSRKMESLYNERMAAILHRRHGGSLETWRRLQDESYVWYQAEGRKLDERPGEDREGDAWVSAVQRLNAGQVLWIFERAGLPEPEDALAYSEALEAETVREIDALYPDTRPALHALVTQGHRLLLSTNANRANAESALIGGGVRDLFDGLAMLETARAKKDRPYYWRRAFALAGTGPDEAVVVDDVVRFLSPAAELGARCIQLLRPGLRHRVIRADDPPTAFPVIPDLTALTDLVR